jgi:hypothetical protein
LIFKTWAKRGILGRRPSIPESRKNRDVLAGVDPALRQKAYDRLAVLRTYYRRLSKPKRPKTKGETISNFLAELNSGILWPDGIAKPLPHVGRCTLYNWVKIYRAGGLAALVPRYRTRLSTGRATFRPLANCIEMKFPGSPRRNGKTEFLARIRRRWKSPPLECPIFLSIFYSMPIPKGIKMPRRRYILKHRISHTGRPNLDALNAFVVDCMAGTVFRNHFQIVGLSSEKKWGWWPETRVLIRALKG